MRSHTQRGRADRSTRLAEGEVGFVGTHTVSKSSLKYFIFNYLIVFLSWLSHNSTGQGGESWEGPYGVGVAELGIGVWRRHILSERTNATPELSTHPLKEERGEDKGKNSSGCAILAVKKLQVQIWHRVSFSPKLWSAGTQWSKIAFPTNLF